MPFHQNGDYAQTVFWISKKFYTAPLWGRYYMCTNFEENSCSHFRIHKWSDKQTKNYSPTVVWKPFCNYVRKKAYIEIQVATYAYPTTYPTSYCTCSDFLLHRLGLSTAPTVTSYCTYRDFLLQLQHLLYCTCKNILLHLQVLPTASTWTSN